jgi:hypothetical protein
MCVTFQQIRLRYRVDEEAQCGAPNQGKRRLAPTLYIHDEALSQELLISTDQRCVRAKITPMGSSINMDAAFATESAAALAMDELQASYWADMDFSNPEE